MIIYAKLWLLLNKKGMKKTDLREVISSGTLAKLGKNEKVSIEVIEKICDFLKCQPGDIMENISKEDVIESGKKINEQINILMETLMDSTGMSKEAILNEFMSNAATTLEKWKNGETDFLGIGEIEKDPAE